VKQVNIRKRVPFRGKTGRTDSRLVGGKKKGEENFAGDSHWERGETGPISHPEKAWGRRKEKQPLHGGPTESEKDNIANPTNSK